MAYIQTLLATQGRELVIVHEADNEQNDLLQDFVAIITSFTTRLYGRRQASRKRSQLLAALELETG
jgi:predicted site-specific integrase-resolvase